jgi:hypothetical protein
MSQYRNLILTLSAVALFMVYAVVTMILHPV